MKAIVFSQYGSFEVLKVKEVEKPVPKEGEVLIQVKAASINDWDLGLMQGKPFIIRMMLGLTKPKINIPGVDVAGTIIKAGKGIKNFKPGDEVFGDLSESGFGTFAEYVCAKEKAIIKKPKEMSFEDAAAIPHAALLAVQGLNMGNIKSGQQILINGAGGGVGTMGIQLAKLYGVHVTGVDSYEKLNQLKSLGYDEVLDYRKEDFTLKRNRYNLILDVKTNRPMFHYARALKRGGKYITVGGSMSRILEATFSGPFFSYFSKKHLRVLGLRPNSDITHVIDLYNQGRFKPVIDNFYRLEEVPSAMKIFAEGKHFGKIVVSVS